jgi:hypothetical protein
VLPGQMSCRTPRLRGDLQPVAGICDPRLRRMLGHWRARVRGTSHIETEQTSACSEEIGGPRGPVPAMPVLPRFRRCSPEEPVSFLSITLPCSYGKHARVHDTGPPQRISSAPWRRDRGGPSTAATASSRRTAQPWLARRRDGSARLSPRASPLRVSGYLVVGIDGKGILCWGRGGSRGIGAAALGRRATAAGDLLGESCSRSAAMAQPPRTGFSRRSRT